MFYRIAWNCSINFDQEALELLCSELKGLGINAFLVYQSFWDWQRRERIFENTDPETGITYYFGPHYDHAKYDRVYNVANTYGLKVFWYTGIEPLDWGKPNLDNKKFIQRYKDFPACGGWLWGDGLNYHSNPDNIRGNTRPHHQLEEAYNKMKSQDPNHPSFAVWGYNLEDSYSKTYSGGHGCDTYDVGCQYIRPYCLTEDPEEDPKTFLRNWIQAAMHMPSAENPVDGFLDCGKGMIPVIQAFGQSPSEERWAPDWKQHLIDQYNIWKDYYSFDVEDPESSVMKGIGFYSRLGFQGGSEEDPDFKKQQEDIREGIKAISTLTGWTE